MKNWIVEWISKNSGIDANLIDDNANIFEVGYVDSFLFMDFISDIESQFGVSFTENQFDDERLFCISGLISMLEELVN